MDVLVVLGDGDAPEQLAARASHVVHSSGDLSPVVLAELRSRIPRDVGVVGEDVSSAAMADLLHKAGFPVTLYTDSPTRIEGVRVLPKTDSGAPMEVANSLLDLVGNTPLVRLDRMGRDLTCHLLAKLEFMNAGGSVKDRPAVAMIEAAEREGLLKEGGTIVEPTSGNTGVGLAIVAARRHYKCVFVMPDKMAPEKISLLRAYGAEVVVCPTAVSPEHPDSYYSVAKRLAEEIPGAFRPNQYANPANPASHVATTGPEIWRQTAGRVTHFVAGVGTGGTISGVGKYLKSQNPDIQIIGADPEGSVYSGGSGRPYLVEGIGEDFWPTTYDPSVVDRVVMVSDQNSFGTARRVTREEGILVGGSAGTAVWAAVDISHELGPEHVVVVLIPDSGRGYLSKLYNDGWMADFGFLRSLGQTVGDVLHRKAGDMPKLVHVHPDETVREAIAILREFGVSQMPVVSAEPPLVAAEVRGAVHERELMERAFSDPGVLDLPLGDVMSAPLPMVGSGEAVELAVQRLEAAPAVLVLESGHPVGILTRSDVLDFLVSKSAG
ncbi:MAG TPA: cystathionine beta-synthase [Acidimicrobiales bacterium]|nr:cystathionine beta-synthase [Acidimicrobiales bacterium]